MIGFQQAKGMFFDRKGIKDRFSKAARKVLSKFGAFVRTRAKQSFGKGKKTSRPGKPPTSRLGWLKGGIFFAADPARESVVIGPVLINKPTGAPEVLEHGGTTTITTRANGGKKKRVRVRIAARPSTGPAFEKEKKNLPALWRDSIK